MSKIAAAIMFAVVTVLSGATHAATIVSFPLDPSRIGSPMPAGAYVAHSSGLNGTPLDGQLLSLDLIYADGILARVLTSTQISMGLSLSTNASFSCTVPGTPHCGNWPGFPGGLTGYLLAPDGSALHSPQAVGGGMTSDGLVIVSLGSVSAPPRPAGLYDDLSGVHLEFFLPNSGFEVTEASLGLVVQGRFATVQFGTAAQLPDGDSWSLIPIALSVMIGALLRVRILRDLYAPRLPEHP